jgi:single-strand DNA-binding protein
MEVTGQLKAKFDTQKVSEKFQKRDFVITTDGLTPYPQHITFQITQDKCSILEKYNVGDAIKVHFNLRGREWNSPDGVKYFNTLEAWRIEKQDGSQQSTPSSQHGEPDDLPF